MILVIKTNNYKKKKKKKEKKWAGGTIYSSSLISFLRFHHSLTGFFISDTDSEVSNEPLSEVISAFNPF